MSGPSHDEHDIAVIGMVGRFPGARHLGELWRNLAAGVESITFFSDQELLDRGVDPQALAADNFVKASPVLEGMDLFDREFFGYSPREASLLDPQQRIFLECAWEVLETAGYEPSRHGGPVGVFAGMSMSSYLLFNLLPHPRLDSREDSFQLMIGSDKDFLATRVSYHLDLKGPSLDVQTGCSTSLVAVHLACEALLSYQCDMALAGGVSLHMPQRWGYFYEEGGIHSPDGHCRAFDADGEGTLFGSGAGVVVLKRLGDALADGDSIDALIKGSAVNNDGSSKLGYTAPGVDGQAEVIARAQAVAGVEPESIQYVEAHGTGTPLGDPVEVAALAKVFAPATPRTGFCGLGSVKSNFGHLDAAAGVAGLIKTILALKHRKLPPSLHFRRPNPKIDFASSPFYVVSELTDWPAGPEPRRAGVSSFGIGGTNVHLILEEAPPVAPGDEPARTPQLLLISARSEPALEAATDRLGQALDSGTTADLEDVAYTLAVGRKRFAYRRAVLCRDRQEAVGVLATRDPQRVWSRHDEVESRPVIFMFPGGGAQHPDMGRELYQTEPAFRQEVDRCAEILTPRLGYDLRPLLYPAPERAEEAQRRMRRTSLALPALFAVGYALTRLWATWGVRPEAMIGHSLGEYLAGCLAGVFSLEDALALVVARGQLFEQLPKGGMLSVPLPEEEVLEWIRVTDPALSVAAVNGPAQCVVSGPDEVLDELGRRLAEAEIEYRELQIEVAAHSRMVDPILLPFRRAVEAMHLSPPRLPFVSNVTGSWITAEEAVDPGYWARQLRETVRFGDGVALLLQEPDRVLLEVGPGRNLTTLAQVQARGAGVEVVASMPHPYDPLSSDDFLVGAVGKLWTAGVDLDWQGFSGGRRRRRVALPTYPFERRRCWIDPPRGDAAQRAGRGERTKEIEDWFHVPAWRSAPPLPRLARGDLAAGAPVLVFDDGGGLGEAVLAHLALDDRPAIRVRRGPELAPDGDDGWWLPAEGPATHRELIERLVAAGRAPGVVLHLWGRGDQAGSTAGTATAVSTVRKTLFGGFLALLQALGEADVACEVWVVADHLYRVVSNDAVAPEKSILLGPLKVAPQEFPHLACRCLDPGCGEVEEIAAAVLAEVRDAGPDRWLAHRGGRRWLQEFAALPLASEGTPRRSLRRGGAYLLTGGFGGVGLHLARYLAETLAAKLVLVGRTPLPERSSWDGELARRPEDDPVTGRIRAVRDLEASGAEVEVVIADVADTGALSAAVARAVERWGRLDGVLHLAGYSGERTVKLISEIDDAEVDLQFEGKVQGVHALEEALAGRDLDFCALFSSNVSVLGGVGAAAYGAANLFLDAYAESRVGREGFPWLSLNWDGWLLGDATRLGTVATSIDRYAMRPEESREAFRRAVEQGPPGEIVVSTGELAGRLAEWQREGDGTEEDWGEAMAAPVRRDLSRPPAPPANAREEAVLHVWRELLGVSDLGVDDNFFDLGGNSLIGLRVISRLRKEMGVDIPVVKLFEGPTVRAFVGLLDQGDGAEERFDDSRSRGERRRQRLSIRARKLDEVAAGEAGDAAR